MFDKVVALYSYLLDNKELKEKIVNLKEEKFLKEEKYLLIGLAIFKKIEELFIDIDKIIFLNDYLKNVRSIMFTIDEYLINSYNETNGYLIYDFLNLEYDKILSELEKMF